MSFLGRNRKPKSRQSLTNDNMRLIVREELENSITEREKVDEEKRKRLLRKKKIEALPKQTRLRLLRHLAIKKGEQHGKK